MNLSINKNQNLVTKYDTNDKKKKKTPFPKTNILIKES